MRKAGSQGLEQGLPGRITRRQRLVATPASVAIADLALGEQPCWTTRWMAGEHLPHPLHLDQVDPDSNDHQLGRCGKDEARKNTRPTSASQPAPAHSSQLACVGATLSFRLTAMEACSATWTARTATLDSGDGSGWGVVGPRSRTAARSFAAVKRAVRAAPPALHLWIVGDPGAPAQGQARSPARRPGTPDGNRSTHRIRTSPL